MVKLWDDAGSICVKGDHPVVIRIFNVSDTKSKNKR